MRYPSTQASRPEKVDQSNLISGFKIDSNLASILLFVSLGICMVFLGQSSTEPLGQRQMLGTGPRAHDLRWGLPDYEGLQRRRNSPVKANPNIVLILADDLGWSDVGFNGGHIYATPNIDTLARNGMHFTSSYQSPNCAPSRASIISGLYPPRHGLYTPRGLSTGPLSAMRLITPTEENVGRWNTEMKEGNWSYAPGHNSIDPEVISIAEVLPSVYVSIRLGKWQLGPDMQGFRYSSSSGRFKDTSEIATSNHKLDDGDQSYYGDPRVGDSLTGAAVEFITAHCHLPFFLYLSHWDVHSPVHCTESRKSKAAKQLVDVKRTNADIPWQSTSSYGGMIASVDDSVGSIQQTLDRLQIDNRSLVVFSSDNGGSFLHTSNAPLSYGKGTLYEGGIRVPTIFCWPGVVLSGSVSDVPIHGIDLFPTFIMAATDGQEHVTRQQELDQLENRLDGINLMSLLTGNSLHSNNRSLFWHFPHYLVGRKCTSAIPMFNSNRKFWRSVPSSAIIRGRFKLILNHESNTSMLFDVQNDLGETIDVSDSNINVKNDLEAELMDWIRSVNAPVPKVLNPHFLDCTKGESLQRSGNCSVHLKDCESNDEE